MAPGWTNGQPGVSPAGGYYGPVAVLPASGPGSSYQPAGPAGQTQAPGGFLQPNTATPGFVQTGNPNQVAPPQGTAAPAAKAKPAKEGRSWNVFNR
jgi:hypothetical protein